MCDCEVHGNTVHAVMRGGQGGPCGGRVHSDDEGMVRWHMQRARAMQGGHDGHRGRGERE